MIAKYLTALFVIVVLSILTGITDGYTTANDFQYTMCQWQNLLCTQDNTTWNIPTEENAVSDWPKGPYALLTPNEGCPASIAKGWRRGYLSFTWKHPFTLMSNTCNDNIENNKSLIENVTEGIDESGFSECWRHITSDMWPVIQTNLLGPFSRHALRLNFCFKTENKTDAEDVFLWPDGLFSIFGDETACPAGFTSSERIIKLPAISSWTSYGFLPDFTVNAEEADDSVTLTLKSCDRQVGNLILNDGNQSYFPTDSFIFLKNDQNLSCQKLQGVDVTAEELQLHQNSVNNGKSIDLFTICHYRPSIWPTDFNLLYYNPQDALPFDFDQAFVILNPTLTYGNMTTRMKKFHSSDIGTQPLSMNYQMITVPWLLIDLGRNMIVVGLQLKEVLLPVVGSKEYDGSLDTTKSGYKCQRWDVQYPHSHDMTRDDKFADKTVSDAENYCRDPTGDGNIWCYTQDAMVRWEYCALRVYEFKQEDRPFFKCFITDDRWRANEFGGIACMSSVSYLPNILYFGFQKELEGRYVKLVGSADTESSRFGNLVRNVEILTSANVLYEESWCNTDLGMSDESIQDFQITASSWIPESPPTSARPFFSGWCSDTVDKNPHIKVDLTKITTIEGITIFNFERIIEDVTDGIYKKRFIPVGSKRILISYTSDFDMYQSVTPTNMTFSLDMFLSLNQPQTLVHEPVKARYISVYILESMTDSAKCLRFELHGCRQYGESGVILPELIAVGSMSTELTSLNNLKTLMSPSVLSSVDYPSHYPGGMSYSWIIDFPEGDSIQLIFPNTSLNTYGEQTDVFGSCNDKLKFLPAENEERMMYIDKQFNGLVTLIQTNVAYMALTFVACRPTTKLQSVGYGFKAIVQRQDIPTCFTPYKTLDKEVENYCSQPMMYLASLSRFNFPDSNVPEKWTIQVNRFPFYLKIVYFNVRCDTGSLIKMNDRFSREKTFCNLRMIPSKIIPDSNILDITFEKGENEITADKLRRKSAVMGFSAMYSTFVSSMTHLIDSQKTHRSALLKFLENERQWDPKWKNSTLLPYQACSKKFEKCYFIYTGAPTSWHTAGAECWIRKSRLVSIHSDEELKLIKYMLRNFRYIEWRTGVSIETALPLDKSDNFYFTHIGLSRVTSEARGNIHVWEDTSPVVFSAWNVNEPSSAGDCTRMSFHLFNTNNTWEAESCETGLANYFICEHNLTPELLSMSDTSTHFYTGILNVTISRKTCQRWDSQYPHRHTVTADDMFPDNSVSDAGNFCRDINGIGKPWCYTVDPHLRWENCFEAETTDTAGTVPNIYSGRLAKTLSGRTCQRWDSDYPHYHDYAVVSQFPDDTLEDAANYCRDPSFEGVLWCYTTDPNKRWETCDFKDTASDICYSTHFLYTGQWNTTISGKTCQTWESQSPHDHGLFLDSQFPDGSVVNASNFCRDPYNEGYLWCFTMDPATKSEPCVFNYKYQLTDETFEVAYQNGTFQCDNGDIIPRQYLCNGKPNCLDLTDESNCTNKVQALMKDRRAPIEILAKMNDTYSVFQCESKEWISMLSRCDSVIDCIDASDEINCSLSLGVNRCSKDEYPCDSGGCIHISQMCDFITDCTDASDENCDYPLCSSTEYRCRNQQCIPQENRCDAYSNCLDGTDETGCDVCKEDAFHCDFVRCIPRRLVCDKYPDCKDESDEMSCDQPVRYSCEEWWIAGYRKSGTYILDNTEAECNFNTVYTEGSIYTTFRNFELTPRRIYMAMLYSRVNYLHNPVVEKIHSTAKELNSPGNSTVNNFFQHDSYVCFQNITQSCVPAHKAAADYEDPSHEDAYRHCDCLVMTLNPGHHESNISDKPVEDQERILFEYHGSRNTRTIALKDNFPTGVEITLGPAICKYEGIFVESDVGCGDENLFPETVRCVYDTDPAGVLLGCRAGQHLQECETFQCPNDTVKCPGSFCLPLKFICDGERQCPGGQDEQDCGCQDDDREVILMYEDKDNEEFKNLRSIATQFYTANSIFRELRYRLRTLPNKLDFDHRILDISDTEINPYSAINREFVCNYSIVASDLINRIKFSKTNASGLIFFQKRNDTDTLARMMFGKLMSKPEFLIYRVMEDTYNDTTVPDSFPFVQNVVVKKWSTLTTVGSMYFPGLCKAAAKVFCPHGYRCAASKTCIPLDHVCDGHAQCIYGDDERLCGYSCPENCSCVEYTTDCSFANIDNTTLPSLNRKSRSLDLSGNSGLRKTLIASKWQFPYLISLNLSCCNIEDIGRNIFQKLVNLRILDLSFNDFSTIPGYVFIGLRKLRNLHLIGNTKVYSLEPFSMTGLLSLKKFELSGATIRKLSSKAFTGLDLNLLNLSDNKINEMEDGVFSGLNVKSINMETNEISSFYRGLFQGVSGMTSLVAPAYKYCCVRPNYLAEENCFPEKDEFSSCDDLLRFSALQTMLWLIGIVALFGNILSVVYRLVYDRNRLKLGYGIFVTNLAVADFLMGVYLIIIAIADAAFRKRYIFMDDFWRNSAWCTIAGFLSTVSSEASVFFLCLITLDRLLIIKYPFGQVRFDTKKAGIACLISWIIALSVGLIPIIFSGYFQGRFYSKSGVCIALPLTRDRPPGWLYSIIVFIGLNFVTFCLIAIGQVAIYLEIKKATSVIRKSASMRGKSGPGRRRELTVARNLLLVVATDFLCWFPIGCMAIMSMAGRMIPGDVYAWTAVFILPINSALNPVLYTLTAILGKKKPEPLDNQSTAKAGSVHSPQRTKKVKPLNGLFRYFITRKDNLGQTFVSLADLPRDGMTIKTADVVKISLNLVRSIRILHKHSLIMGKLDESVVFTSVEYGKFTGDVQLRHEPTVCFRNEEKADDICQLGQVLRSLLAKRNICNRQTAA